MWFRRRRRLAPPTLLPSLDRLAELIERVVALLDQVSLAPEPGSRAEVTAARGNHAPAAAVAAPYLIFVPSPDGYGLLERNGSAPAAGATTDVEGVVFLIVRLGPSPLPGDRRRCAFLEEDPAPERTFDE